MRYASGRRQWASKKPSAQSQGMGTDSSRAPIAPAQQPRKRSRFGSFVRGVLAVLMIAIVAGLIAAVILLATDAGQSSDIGRFISDNVDEQVQNIKDYINQATGQ